MNELATIFDKIAEEQAIYHKIKAKSLVMDPIRARMMFNYYLYNSIYNMDQGHNAHDLVVQCIKNFVIKEATLSPQAAIVNNTYQMAIMLDKDLLMRVLIGQQTNFLLLNNDAAKLGALMAMDFKITGIPKSELLQKTLLLA